MTSLLTIPKNTSPQMKRAYKLENNIKKYHSFLMRVYLLASSGYIAINTKELITKDKVSKFSFTSMIRLGYIKSTGEMSGKKYFWPACAPTEDQAEKLYKDAKEAVRRYKAGLALKANANPTTITHYGKTLVRVADQPKREKKIDARKEISSHVIANYFQAMKALKTDIENKKNVMGLTLYIKTYTLGAGFGMLLRQLGFIEKKDKYYKWIGGEPTLDLARLVIEGINEYVRKHTNPKPSSTQPIQISPVENVIEVSNPVITTQPTVEKRNEKVVPLINNSNTDSNKAKADLAAKFAQVGNLEMASKLLDEVLNQK